MGRSYTTGRRRRRSGIQGSGQHRPYSPLIKALGKNWAIDPESVLPSPDGTWILVRPRLGASRRVAVSYDGRRTITVELSPFDTAIWLTKSGMFATDFESNVFPSTTLTYHSLLNPARQRQEMLAPTPRNDTNVTSLARPDPFSTPGPAAPPIADEQNVQAVPVSI